MALGPDHIKQIDQEALKRIEAEIDATIQRATPGTRTVYVTPPPGFSVALMTAIREMYQKAGWCTVKNLDDQREGCSIVLSMDRL